jgi:hypothetical protein
VAAVLGVAWLGAPPLRNLSVHRVRRGGGGGAGRGRGADWVGEEVKARGGLRAVR